jgi:hypothetical protein
MEINNTIGSLAYQALQKDPESRDPIELQRELQKNYIDELIQCTETTKKQSRGDFYIVVITKRERLLQPVLRNYFVPRTTCPTPDYDQTVYKYNKQDDCIEYLWCIPDKETCLTFKENALQIVPNERHLLKHILDFADGTLFALCKKLNKEHDDSPLLEL